MKKTFWILLASLALTAGARAADYKVDPSHSSVGFEVRHLVGNVQGQFKDYEGTFSFDEKDLSKFKLKSSAKAATIDTSNAKRDEHLKSPDFFDVKKFPVITFESSKIEKKGSDYEVSGNFTMHGVTKPVTFEVESLGEAKDPWGNMRRGFTARTKLNRKDFGILWNKTFDTGSTMLGEDVKVTLNLEAIEEKAKK
jgi:polyisoprenoid-binding protein YceI